MTDVVDGVRGHYRATGLTERLRTALAALGPEDQGSPPSDWAPSTSFTPAGSLRPPSSLSSLGSRPICRCWMSARAAADQRASWRRPVAAGSRAPTSASHYAACYLTERMGQSGKVWFETASALDLPFDDGQCNVVLLEHVAMNISDRGRLYRELRRALGSGGRFATFDVVLNNGEPH